MILNNVIPWILVGVGVCLVVSVPLLMFRRTRPYSASLMIFGSWGLGAAVWLGSCYYTLSLWGCAALLIGLVLLGVGVVPMALLALAIRREWTECFWLIGFATLTFAMRYVGFWIASKLPDRPTDDNGDTIAPEARAVSATVRPIETDAELEAKWGTPPDQSERDGVL